MGLSEKREPTQNKLYIPAFTPPPVTKDWERSFDTPLIKHPHTAKESSRVLRALHFFFEGPNIS